MVDAMFQFGVTENITKVQEFYSQIFRYHGEPKHKTGNSMLCQQELSFVGTV